MSINTVAQIKAGITLACNGETIATVNGDGWSFPVVQSAIGKIAQSYVFGYTKDNRDRMVAWGKILHLAIIEDIDAIMSFNPYNITIA
jgi:hypothetical protein